MLTEICQHLHNWFDRDQAKWIGSFVIDDNGHISLVGGALSLQDGQYYRIVGSLFNDGVHKYPSTLMPEEFHGAVWSMAIPPVVVSLADEIKLWQDKYGGYDSVNMSPYNSESFGGYSYSKSGGGASANGQGGTWQSAFASRLNPWRKLP